MGNEASTGATQAQRAMSINLPDLQRLRISLWKNRKAKNGAYSPEELERARKMVSSLKAYGDETESSPARAALSGPESTHMSGLGKNTWPEPISDSGASNDGIRTISPASAENVLGAESPDCPLPQPVSFTSKNHRIFEPDVALDPTRTSAAGSTTVIRRDVSGRWGFDLLASPPENGIKVYSVHDGSPAYLAGVQVGATIMTINDDVVFGMPYADIVARLDTAGDCVRIRFSESVEQAKISEVNADVRPDSEDRLEHVAALKLQAYFKTIMSRKHAKGTIKHACDDSNKSEDVPSLPLDSEPEPQRRCPAKPTSTRRPKRHYRDPLYDVVTPKQKITHQFKKKYTKTLEKQSRKALKQKKHCEELSVDVPEGTSQAPLADVVGEAVLRVDEEDVASNGRDVTASLIQTFRQNETDRATKEHQRRSRKVSFESVPIVHDISDDAPLAKPYNNIDKEGESICSTETGDRMKIANDEDSATPNKSAIHGSVSVSVKEGGLAMKIRGSKIHAKLMGTYLELEDRYKKSKVFCKFDKDHKAMSFFYYRDKSWKISTTLGKQLCAISTTSPATRPDKARSIWYEARGPNGKAMQGHPGIICVAVAVSPESQNSSKGHHHVFGHTNAQRQLYL